MLSGPCGLQDKVKNGTAEFSVGPGEKWNSVKTKKTFEKWLSPEGLLEQGYDCFFSYRWTTKEWGGMDTDLVDGIYHKSLCTDRLIGERQVQFPLDRHRLKDGRRFDKDFVKALFEVNCSCSDCLMCGPTENGVFEQGLSYRQFVCGMCNCCRASVHWCIGVLYTRHAGKSLRNTAGGREIHLSHLAPLQNCPKS
jgi:hypothetical protein